MLKTDEQEAGSRVPGHYSVRVLLPETAWKEFDVIARKYSIHLNELLVQSIYWTSAPFRSDAITVSSLRHIVMPGNSGDGCRVFELKIQEQVYFEIEDLARGIGVKPCKLMTQFLLHALFDGPLAGTLHKLTGEDGLKRQSTWKPEVRRILGLAGGAR